MMMLLVYSLFSTAFGQTVITGGECSKYYVMGPSGYRDMMAHKDPDDPSMLGKSGQAADDTRWIANKDPPYPAGQPKSCTPSSYSGITCGSVMETHNFMAIETCATMRFSFAAGSESSVWLMKNNATFQACDFDDGATEITDGGDLTTGDRYIDFPVDNDRLDTELYFASKVGCTEGQKLAITVVETMGKSYADGLNDGKQTIRIQHCDCDHKMNPEGGTEAYHMGFVEGCKSEMPDDLSCCNPDTECATSSRQSSYYGPSGCKKTHLSKPYNNGGQCNRKSDQKYMIEVARKVHNQCKGAKNAECDKWLAGYTCPWYRTYNGGAWVFNTDLDGTDKCHGRGECTGNKDPKYPAVPNVCTAAAGCQTCYGLDSVYHGRCSGFCSKMLQRPAKAPNSKYKKVACTSGWYCMDTAGNGIGRSGMGCNETLAELGLTTCEEDVWIGETCDGANSTYTPHCDMWFMASHCKGLADMQPLHGAHAKGNFTEAMTEAYASDEDAQFMIERDVTEESCGASRYTNAYNQYASDPAMWDEWLGVEDTTATAAADPVADLEGFTTPAAVGLMLAVLAWK
jgi:hypothetical protein